MLPLFFVVVDSPYALIVCRYLSLLDAAVELEYQDYTGPRLQDTHKVLMFDHALTADEVNRKYRYCGGSRDRGYRVCVDGRHACCRGVINGKWKLHCPLKFTFQ